jgi:Domain of unknown function (DUF5666)
MTSRVKVTRRQILIGASLVSAGPLFHVALAQTTKHVERSTQARAGIVTTLDDGAKTFGCHWKTRDWTYRTTDKTTFRIGGQAGSWSDLKVGQTVKVSYHWQDKNRVADRVTITKQ